MKPQDIRKVVRWYKYIFKKVLELRGLAQESIDIINDGLEENDSQKAASQEYIIGANHKLEKAHNINPLRSKKAK